MGAGYYFHFRSVLPRLACSALCEDLIIPLAHTWSNLSQSVLLSVICALHKGTECLPPSAQVWPSPINKVILEEWARHIYQASLYQICLCLACLIRE
jgi:hypothetical protein